MAKSPGRPRVSPTDKELKMYLRRGLTHEDIAEEVFKKTGIRLGCSTISVAIVRAGVRIGGGVALSRVVLALYSRDRIGVAVP